MKTNSYVIYYQANSANSFGSDYYRGLSFDPKTDKVRFNWEVPFFVYEDEDMALAEVRKLVKIMPSSYVMKVVPLGYIPNHAYMFIDVKGNQSLVEKEDAHKIISSKSSVTTYRS